MEVWLERLDRFLTIIRPKTYNVIARVIVGLGVLLVTESQLNLVQSIVVATYERLFGYSDILREFLEGSSSPWVGLFLIVVGLIYHYLMIVGREQVELQLSKIPKKAYLNLELRNADSEEYKDNTINLRGCILDVPLADEIPEYRTSYDSSSMDRISGILGAVGNMERNPKFYQERAELLKVWGGSELLSLRIANSTEVLATGVKVEIKFPRVAGVSADNTKKEFPTFPREKSKNRFGLLPSLSLSHQPIHYDIKRDHSEGEYCFYWNVGDVQANTSCISDTYIFLRSEESFDLELRIYCDQFSRPIRETYKVNKKGEVLTISVADLMAEKECFNDIVDKCVMDGHFQRVAERVLAKHEHKAQEVIPGG